MISRDTIQIIIDTARIEEVVGDFVALKRRGGNLTGLCPFHNEKTPSFSVSPSKGIYKCFGCGKAGNAVNFVMEHEHATYPEALRYLARRYNIEIEEEKFDAAQEEAASERENMFQVNSFAADYFSGNLFETEEGKAIGLTYFEDKRGFTEESIKLFKLGYSINEWDGLIKASAAAGFSSEYFVKTGLTIEKENKKYDIFRGRVMFPIHNIAGRIVGFGGRILSNDKTKPKYVNSSESEIYNKSNILYGIYFAKNAIAARNNCYLVEGYTDVISMHQAGIANVVASSGTSLTTGQIKLIKRYTPNITMLFDGDPAGIKASFRGTDMILAEGMNVRIVLFPEGEDPDSFARNHRPAEVQEFITRNSVDFINFKTNLLLKEVANDPVRKASLVKEIIQTISLIPDAITRGFYIRECSSLMEVAEQTLINELNKQLRANLQKSYGISQNPNVVTVTVDTATNLQPQPLNDLTDSFTQEREVIRMLLAYGNKELSFLVPDEDSSPTRRKYNEVKITVAEFIITELNRDSIKFTNIVCQKIFDVFFENLNDNIIPSSDFFLSHQDSEIIRLSGDLLISPYDLANWAGKPKIYVPAEDHNLQKTVETIVLAFKSKRVEKEITENTARIAEAQAAGNEELLMQLLSVRKKLDTLKRLINSEKLGRVIIR